MLEGFRLGCGFFAPSHRARMCYPVFSVFFLMIRRPPRSTLFPYTNALPIFAPIPADKVPNLKDLPKKFIDSRGLGAFCSAQIIGLAYNPEKIKTPPKSWNDLLKPEYKGRVGLSSMGSTLISAWMVEIARINGGSEDNMEPAFAYLKKLLPNVAAVATSP